eukprot:g25635.t1
MMDNRFRGVLTPQVQSARWVTVSKRVKDISKRIVKGVNKSPEVVIHFGKNNIVKEKVEALQSEYRKLGRGQVVIPSGSENRETDEDGSEAKESKLIRKGRYQQVREQ